MKLIYIAGPYRAETSWGVEQNIRRAEQVAYSVAEEGLFPVCPHSNTRGYFESLQSPEFWLMGTMALLLCCDAIMTVPGWGNSPGARAEVARAQVEGMPVCHTITQLRRELGV